MMLAPERELDRDYEVRQDAPPGGWRGPNERALWPFEAPDRPEGTPPTPEGRRR